MKKSPKRNPKRVPKTQADVDRAWQEGADFGIEFCINNFLLVLKDKWNMADDEIYRLRGDFLAQIDSINGKFCSYADVKRALGGDYNLFVRLEDNK